MTWEQKSGDSGWLFKLDIEKAFDKLNWAYLFTILRRMGFENRWIRWIKFSLTTVKYFVLINRGLQVFSLLKRAKGRETPYLPFFSSLLWKVLARCSKKHVDYNGLKASKRQSHRRQSHRKQCDSFTSALCG